MIPITVCMITKNEEGTIERALKAIKNYPFELIVCDTGSTDSTRDIALKYADKVVDFEWINDFSAARNYCASFASNDWILAIDSDEYIVDINMDELQNLMRNNVTSLGRILIRSTHYGISSNEEALDTSAIYIDRLYHKKYIHFEQKVHEQLKKIAGGVAPGFMAPIIVDHSGYAVSPDKLLEKNQRNIDLLFSTIEEFENAPEKPEDRELAYLYFQLGTSYSAIKDFTSAHFYFEKAFSYNLPSKLVFVHLLAVKYGFSLINIGYFEQAKAYVEDMYPTFATYADFVFMAGVVYKFNRQYPTAILHLLRATTLQECTEAGVTTYSAYFQIGDCYAAMEQYDMAKMFFEKAGDLPAAKDALQRLEKLMNE